VSWTPLIVRELIAGAHSFNDIHRGVPLISRAVLARGCVSKRTTVSSNTGRVPAATGMSIASRPLARACAR
jgi:hypothetical protein